MVWVQAKLVKGNAEQTAWIKKKKGVKVGCSVELKETKEFWEVKALYSEMTSEKMLARQKADKTFGMSIK